MTEEQVKELANEMKKTNAQFNFPYVKSAILEGLGYLKDMKKVATNCDFGQNVRLPKLEKCLKDNIHPRRIRRVYFYMAMTVYDNMITMYKTLEDVGRLYRTPDLIIGDFLSCKHHSSRASMLKTYYTKLMTILRKQSANNADMKNSLMDLMPLFEKAATLFKALDIDRLEVSLERLIERVGAGLKESSVFEDIVHLKHILRRLENMQEPVYEKFIKETLQYWSSNKTRVKELYRMHLARWLVTNVLYQPEAFRSTEDAAVLLNTMIESLDQFSQNLEGNGTDAIKLDKDVIGGIFEFYIIPSYVTFPAPEHLTDEVLKDLDKKFYSKEQGRPKMQLGGTEISYRTLFLLQFLGLMYQ